MKEITIKVYNFSELKPEIQTKVLENFRTINVDDNEWYENLFEEWKEKLSDFGFENAEIFYSGFYSQGSGACFDADINLEKILENENFPEKFKKVLNNEMDNVKYIIYKNSLSNHYSHENTRDISVEYFSKFNMTFGFIREWLEENRIKFCKEIYSNLKMFFENLTKDEQVKKTIEANEYYFEEDGTLRNINF